MASSYARLPLSELLEDTRDGTDFSLPSALSPIQDAGDVVQFSAVNYYANESEGTLTIEVLRLGSLLGDCSISYDCIDDSAFAGEQYERASGTLLFKSGEALKTIDVGLLSSQYFHTTLSFYMELFSPQHCKLDSVLRITSVYVLDDNYFPSDKLRVQIDSRSVEALLASSAVLLVEFFKYTYNCVPNVWWKSLVILSLDQLRNIYYLGSIFLRVYLIDTILNVKDPDSHDRLLVPDNRRASTILLAALWTFPNILLTMMDRIVVGSLDMGFSIRWHLRVSVFRKFLNYTDWSRNKIGIEDITVTQTNSIPVLVDDGYLGIFEMIKEIGKICCMAVFIIHSHPHSIITCLIFPMCITLFMKSRQQQQLHLLESAAEGMQASQTMVSQACSGFDVIRDYNQKSRTVTKYEKQLTSQRTVTLDLTIYEWWNDQLIPGVSILSLGAYMAIGALAVLDGSISIGTFLAALNVYKDLGDKFGGVHKRLNAALDSIEPLVEVTNMLNLPIDLPALLKANRDRRQYVRDQMKACETSSKDGSSIRDSSQMMQKWDEVPICFSDVTLDHVPTVKNFTCSFKTGSLVTVFGPHGCGKRQVFKMICGRLQAATGSALHSPHQIILHVGHAPHMIRHLNLLENMRFGAPEDFAHPELVKKTFKRVSQLSDDHWMMEQLHQEIATGESDPNWWRHLSHWEQKMIQMTRCLTYCPQILVLSKPLDDLEIDVATRILQLLTEFVQKDHEDKKRRTVFVSTGTTGIRDLIRKKAQYEWEMSLTAPPKVTELDR